MSEQPRQIDTAAEPSTVDHHARGALAGSRVLVGRRVVVTVGSAIATAAIARSLTTHDFAVYSVALAAFFLAMAVCDLGFAQVAAREMSQRPADRSAVMWSSLVLNGAWSCLVAAGFVVYAFLASDGSARVALLILVPALAVSGLAVARQWFVVRYEVGWIARVDLVLNLLQVLALVGLAWRGVGPVALLAVVAFTAVVNTGVVAVAVVRRIDRGRRRDDDRRSILRMALPIGIPSVLASAYFSVDLLIAASILESTQVAQYAAAVKFLTMLAIVPQILMGMALPGFSVLSSQSSPERLGELVGVVWHWLVALGVPMCVGIAAYASLATGVLFGPEYEEAAAIVRILMLASVVSFASNVLGTLVVAQGLAGRMFYQNIAALVLTVLLNIWLLPIFGIEGAAWITVGIEVFLVSMSFLWLRHRCDWTPVVAVSIRPLLCCTTIGLTAALPFGRGWAQLGLSIVVFVAAMSLARAWPFATGLKDLRSAFRRRRRTSADR